MRGIVAIKSDFQDSIDLLEAYVVRFAFDTLSRVEGVKDMYEALRLGMEDQFTAKVVRFIAAQCKQHSLTTTQTFFKFMKGERLL